MSLEKRAAALADRHKEANISDIISRLSMQDIKSQVSDLASNAKSQISNAVHHPRTWTGDNKRLLATAGTGAALGGLMGSRDGGGLGGALAGATAGGLTGAGGYMAYKNLAPSIKARFGEKPVLPPVEDSNGTSFGETAGNIAAGAGNFAAGTATSAPVSSGLLAGAAASDAWTANRMRDGRPELSVGRNPFITRLSDSDGKPKRDLFSWLRHGTAANERRNKSRAVASQLDRFIKSLGDNHPDSELWRRLQSAAAGGNDDVLEMVQEASKARPGKAAPTTHPFPGSMRRPPAAAPSAKFTDRLNRIFGEVSEDTAGRITPGALDEALSRKSHSWRHPGRRARGYAGLLAASQLEPYLWKGLGQLGKSDRPDDASALALYESLKNE